MESEGKAGMIRVPLEVQEFARGFGKAADETLRQDYAIIRDLVDAMVEWGSWEDGVPGFGSVGEAYDRAVEWLQDVEAHFGWPAGGAPRPKGRDQ